MKPSNTRKTTAHRATSDSVLRRALSQLKAPSEEAMLSSNVAELARKVEAMLASGKISSSQLQSALDRFTSQRDNPAHILDLTSSLSKYVPDQNLVSLLLEGLYVPTADVAGELVLPDHGYWASNTWYSSPCSASASDANGNLAATAIYNKQNYTTKGISSSAANFIKLYADPSSYGRLSRVTVEAKVDWQGTIIGNNGTNGNSGNSQWPINIAGFLSVIGMIVVDAYQWNPATGQWEPTPNDNANFYTAFQMGKERAIDSAPLTPYKGQFQFPEAVKLQFIADPATYYAIGVHAQVQITNNFTETDGKPAPPPPDGFGWSGTITANVPYMLVSHVVLAH